MADDLRKLLNHIVRHYVVHDEQVGIELDASHFDVTCILAANLFIAGVVHMPAAVAGQHAPDAAQIGEHRFDAPEAAAAEYGDFIARRGLF